MQTNTKNVLDGRELACRRILRSLIEAQPVRFLDKALPVTLPKAHGLYAISAIGAAEGEYLHVGKSKNGKSGLWGRVWEQHYQTGDLLDKVRRRLTATGRPSSPAEARKYVRQNCQVQWVVVEDDATPFGPVHAHLGQLILQCPEAPEIQQGRWPIVV